MYGNSRQSWILDSMDSRNWISDSLCVELEFRIPIYLKLDPGFLELYYDSKAQNFGTRVFEFLYIGL